MDYLLKITILGIVQGITEFLPISSNAHLIIVEQLLNYQNISTIVANFPQQHVEQYR